MDHPNIAGLHDMWMPLEPGQPPPDELYLTLDLFDTDLSQIIKSSHAISRDHIRVVVYQTVRGLRFIHQHGVIHRDLKPANLLVSKDCHVVPATSMSGSTVNHSGATMRRKISTFRNGSNCVPSSPPRAKARHALPSGSARHGLSTGPARHGPPWCTPLFHVRVKNRHRWEHPACYPDAAAQTVHAER